MHPSKSTGLRNPLPDDAAFLLLLVGIHHADGSPVFTDDLKRLVRWPWPRLFAAFTLLIDRNLVERRGCGVLLTGAKHAA